VSTSELPIVIENLSAGYGKRTVFSGMNLQVEPGQIFGLVGLNGVGKTTMIKTILDLLSPRSGSVRILGQPSTIPSSRVGLAYLPERFYPSRYLNGWEYLRFRTRMYGLPLDRPEAAAMAGMLSLDVDALGRRISTFSKGMGQKLGLIATLVADRPLVILDEPMSGLDPQARVELKAAMCSYRDRGRTIFFSSHILADIEEICDSIGVLHAGRLIYVGAPREFTTHHGSPTLEQAFLRAINEVDVSQTASAA
jgi:ABC-2 type transport system ATP-binding protein